MLGKIIRKRPREVSEEDVWEAFMGFNNDKTENKYQVLADHIEESKPKEPSTELQVYKEPLTKTYYEYFSNKIYSAYQCIVRLFR